MRSVVTFDDFREFIRAKIGENRSVRGYRSRLAEAAGFQLSFLSHVIHSHVLITPDHALAMSRFWGLNPVETDYFLHLVDCARARTMALRQFHQAKLEALRQSAYATRPL